jgi:hypothetical protein
MVVSGGHDVGDDPEGASGPNLARCSNAVAFGDMMISWVSRCGVRPRQS